MGQVLRISSWNMQGNGRGKINYIQPQNSDDKIVQFCQESGVPETTGFNLGESYGSYVCVNTAVDAVASNQRCTTSCLVSKNIARDCVPLKFESSLHRPVIGCTFHGTDLGLFTYHATANDAESVLEVKKIIEALNTECGSNGKWILMGDFNSTPDRYDCDNRLVSPNWLNYIRVSSTRARATERDYCYLLFSDRPTQGARGTRTRSLDYVFMSKALGESGLIYSQPNPQVENYSVTDGANSVISDHNRITIGLNLGG